MIVEFDCWLSGTDFFTVLVYKPVRQQNYLHAIRKVVPDRWGHHVLRFADLHPVERANAPAQEGDRLENVAFSTAIGAGTFIDNVEIRQSWVQLTQNLPARQIPRCTGRANPT
jgi:hypothetical protein